MFDHDIRALKRKLDGDSEAVCDRERRWICEQLEIIQELEERADENLDRLTRLQDTMESAISGMQEVKKIVRSDRAKETLRDIIEDMTEEL